MMDDKLEVLIAGHNDITCIYAAKGLAPFFYDIEKPDIGASLKKYREKLDSCLAGRLGKDLVKAAERGDMPALLRIANKITEKSGVPYDDVLREAVKLMSPEVARQEAELEQNRSLGEEGRERESSADLRKAGIETNKEYNAFLFASNMHSELHLKMPIKPQTRGREKVIGSMSLLKRHLLLSIDESVSGVVYSLSGGYEGSLFGLSPKKLVVPDFAHKASEYLLNEAYARDGKGEFAFLDAILMSVSGDEVAWRPNERFQSVYCLSSFKWSQYLGKG